MNNSERPIDAEGICTRIAARLIEQLAAVEITPDSPHWEDLSQGDRPVGQLRVYRGRDRVQKVVGSCYRLEAPAMEAHSLVIFTRSDSPVPHLVIDAVSLGSTGTFRVDLLPKRDLAVALDYVDTCFAPLSAIQAEIDRDARFTRTTAPLRQRALLSPWSAFYVYSPDAAVSALAYVERHFDHWASLLCSDEPALCSRDDSLCERDVHHRRLLFSRDVDPVWRMLDRVLGCPTVDRMLAVLGS